MPAKESLQSSFNEQFLDMNGIDGLSKHQQREYMFQNKTQQFIVYKNQIVIRSNYRKQCIKVKEGKNQSFCYPFSSILQLQTLILLICKNKTNQSQFSCFYQYCYFLHFFKKFFKFHKNKQNRRYQSSQETNKDKTSLYNFLNQQRLRMKSKQPQTPKQPVKLPSIGNKTMGDITKDSNKQSQRPLSSKNIVNDLEKKLFSHLESYDEKGMGIKGERGSSKIKSKTNSTILASSCREITTKSTSMQSDSMEKIAQFKVMPQLYSKIIQSKKYQDPKPLKQTYSFTNEQPSPKQNTSIQMKKKPQKSPLLQSRTSTRVPSAKSTTTKQQKQSPTDSFDFAQREIDNIYKEYLKMEGLDQEKETSVSDLRQMNESLNRCEVDIEELERNYSNLIKQLGDICVNEIE